MKSHRIWSESGETGLRLKKKKKGTAVRILPI